MSQLYTFPEDDLCPGICPEKGGFVKSKNVKNQEVDEQKHVNDKHVSRNYDENVAHEFLRKEEDSSLKGTPKIEKCQVLKRSPIKTDVDLSHRWTRMPVSKHSLNRHSLNDWKKHNETVLDCSEIFESNILNYNAQTAIGTGFGNMDQAEHRDNNLLKDNAKTLYRWKVEVELLCKAMAKEVNLLETERRRVKGALTTLLLPEAISKECIELRSNRADTELVVDIPEQELAKERELVNEVRAMLTSTLHKIDEQLADDRAAKHRIEYDCSDKTVAYTNEAKNLGLTTRSNTLMFKPGAVKFGDNTAPTTYWEYYCHDNVRKVEAVRQTSENLRSTLDDILINNGRKLRNQADKTDTALAETIAHTTELVTKLEEGLRCTLRSLAETELMIKHLQESILKSDRAMKLAQTRLDNRNIGRPHGENVSDRAHVGLLHEVKLIHSTVTSFHAQLKSAGKTRLNLMAKRIQLERDIAAKRKSLNIDRERCGMIRSHYPTASELSGL